jgi:predicted lipid-binding transport protein (Tim44 family)
MMMIGLLVMAAVVVIGLIMRRRATLAPPAMAGAGRMPYGPVDYLPEGVSSSSRDAAASVSTRNVPHDFDVASFGRQAKVNFMRLQAANDAGNLNDLRDVTTPGMFAELKVSILARHGESQHTDVLEVDADVIEVTEEPSRYVVSVLYRGMILEEKDGKAESINEIWHLEKPRHGQSGWLVSGIQKIQQSFFDAFCEPPEQFAAPTTVFISKGEP